MTKVVVAWVRSLAHFMSATTVTRFPERKDTSCSLEQKLVKCHIGHTYIYGHTYIDTDGQKKLFLEVASRLQRERGYPVHYLQLRRRWKCRPQRRQRQWRAERRGLGWPLLVAAAAAAQRRTPERRRPLLPALELVYVRINPPSPLSVHIFGILFYLFALAVVRLYNVHNEPSLIESKYCFSFPKRGQQL